MEKQPFLESVTEAGRAGVASEAEVLNAYRAGSRSERPALDVSRILSYLGSGIVAIGIAIFVSQNWDALNVATHILVTLGVGVITFIAGNLLLRSQRTQLGLAIHLIAAITLTLGLFVTFDALGWDVSQSSIGSLIFGFLVVVYGIAYRVLRHSIFALGSVLSGSALFVTLTSWMDQGVQLENFERYQLVVLGLAWVLLGHFWSTRKEAVLTPYLYCFGLPMFFLSAILLGGDPPSENWFWMILFPALALGSILLSPTLKSRFFLVWGTLFLVVDIFKVTDAYFGWGFGWPLALIIAGLALMAVGTLVVRVNTQYAAQKHS